MDMGSTAPRNACRCTHPMHTGFCGHAPNEFPGRCCDGEAPPAQPEKEVAPDVQQQARDLAKQFTTGDFDGVRRHWTQESHQSLRLFLESALLAARQPLEKEIADLRLQLREAVEADAIHQARNEKRIKAARQQGRREESERVASLAKSLAKDLHERHAHQYPVYDCLRPVCSFVFHYLSEAVAEPVAQPVDKHSRE